jgi:predicted PurR-regulated permease PerM
MLMAPSKTSRPDGLLVAVVVIAALYLARVVFIPLALALLFSLLLTPVVSLLERVLLPRLLAIFMVVLVLLGLGGLLGWEASQQFVDLTQQLPVYQKTLEDKIHSLPGSHNQSLSRASDTIRELARDVAAVTPGSSLATDAKKTNSAPGTSTSKPMAVEIVPPANSLESVQNMLGPLVTAGVIAVFTIFILMGREDLRNRFIRLAAGGRLNAMTQALDDATRRVNRYLLLQLSVNAIYGLVIGAALHFIGIPNASLWGLCAGVLRFLPYVGPPMAAMMPVLLALAVFGGWGHALATVGLFFALELTVSNFIEPLLYGTHVGLSPLAILVAAIFWTLIWGFPGLVLSTPLTVCLVVMGRYVPSLKFLTILLGDEPALSAHVQYYQRLLATDQGEARQVLEDYLKEKPVEDLYGSVVIPALSLAEQDRHRNVLDDEIQNFIYQSTREIIEELEDDPSDVPGDGKAEDHVDVLCVPARDDADEVVAMLLTRLLLRQGHTARSIAVGTRSETLSKVSEVTPAIVCISALPPFAVSHAGTLYASLRSEFPDLHIVICLWQFEGDSSAMAVRLKLAKDHGFFTTLPQTLLHVTSRLPEKAKMAEGPGAL